MLGGRRLRLGSLTVLGVGPAPKSPVDKGDRSSEAAVGGEPSFAA